MPLTIYTCCGWHSRHPSLRDSWLAAMDLPNTYTRPALSTAVHPSVKGLRGNQNDRLSGGILLNANAYSVSATFSGACRDKASNDT